MHQRTISDEKIKKLLCQALSSYNTAVVFENDRIRKRRKENEWANV